MEGWISISYDGGVFDIRRRWGDWVIYKLKFEHETFSELFLGYAKVTLW